MASFRSTYLGQFDEAHAERIAAALEEAGIDWSFKRSGAIARLVFAGDWGVRVFVDATRVADAKEIVARTAG